jgi:hypothetical protein
MFTETLGHCCPVYPCALGGPLPEPSADSETPAACRAVIAMIRAACTSAKYREAT